MDPTPSGLSLAGGRLVIEWSDGERRSYEIVELRAGCPCATCLSRPSTRQPQPADLAIRQMQPVGNYAYRIEFTDGHATGIYPLELLRRLGTKME